MDKSGHFSGDSTTSSSSNANNRDHYLKHLNKLSHKISKPASSASTVATNGAPPPLVKKPSFEQNQKLSQALPPQPPSQPSQTNPNQSSLQQAQQQHQPPVYNINKNDFRDVVQKLTGSPAHDRFSTPPPIHQPKPQSSRLQRIRPPPLAHVSNHPPPMMNSAFPNMNPSGFSRPNPVIGGPTGGNSFIHQRPPAATAPLSPLPPFPSVHAAAESPVSAYMRFLQSSMSMAAPVDSNPKQFSGFPPLAPLVSPRWNHLTATQQQLPPQQQQPPLQQPQQQQPPQVSSTGMIQSQLPSSPLPFGCLNSPRSPYALLSPSLLFSPNSGQLGFPLSPTVPVSSPKW